MEQDRTTLKLLSSKNEAGNVRTFVFETGGLTWIAGQSQAWVLPQAGKTDDENRRWFTISSAPSEGTMNISTRISESAFKQALNALSPGDTIERYGIEGNFTWEDEPSDRVVLVAGGIGVTPFRSILHERRALGKKLNATLLYFNRTDEIPFRESFEAFAREHPEFLFIPIVGEQITGESIFAHVPQARERLLYLSGPEPMVESVGAELKKEGVNIKQDWFPGYTEKSY